MSDYTDRYHVTTTGLQPAQDSGTVSREDYDALAAERDELREALMEAEKTLCVLHSQVASEYQRGARRWEGVPKELDRRIADARQALQRTEKGDEQ